VVKNDEIGFVGMVGRDTVGFGNGLAGKTGSIAAGDGGSRGAVCDGAATPKSLLANDKVLNYGVGSGFTGSDIC